MKMQKCIQTDTCATMEQGISANRSATCVHDDVEACKQTLVNHRFVNKNLKSIKLIYIVD